MENKSGHIDYIKLTKESNFMNSYFFLSKEKKNAITIIYAFCRKSDDIVDDETISIDSKLIELKKWKENFICSVNNNIDDDLLMQLKDVREKYSIPEKPFIEMLEGMEMDLTRKRYNSINELTDYCYKVASTAGLMSIQIFGWSKIGSEEYAKNLGIALQLTNIIRDVRKDKNNGRIYIPFEDLKKFNYSEMEFQNEVYNSNFIELMEYETERALKYYENAKSFYSKNDIDLMISSRIIYHIYLSLLKKIIKNNYRLFDKEIKLSKFKKFIIAFGVFIKYKYYHPIFN